MKKFLVILLALTLTFSLVACGGSGKGKKPGVSDFTKALTATAPKTAQLTVKATVSGVELESSFTTTYNEDKTAVINYYYDYVNTYNSGNPEELVERASGTVNVAADGNYTDGAEFSGKVPVEPGTISLKFNTKKMDYTVSADGNVLNATIKAANTEDVLGVAIAGDVVLTVTKADGKISSFTLEYTTDVATVNVNAFYTH